MEKMKLLLGIVIAFFLCFVISGISNDVSTKPPTTVITLSPMQPGQLGQLISPMFCPLPVSKVTIVKLEGEISRSWSIPLEEAFKDSSCKTVIAWIESGGGGVSETEILSHRIELLKKKYKKSFIVYTEEWMMSGAYWVACDADAIIVSPASMLGSIGVYMQREDVTQQESAAGIIVYTFRSGDLKNIGDKHVPMTTKEALFWQNMVLKHYKDFLLQIMVNRYNVFDSVYTLHNKAKADSSTLMMELIKVADGRPYFADEALYLGLCDKIVWLDEIVDDYVSKGYTVDTLGSK